MKYSIHVDAHGNTFSVVDLDGLYGAVMDYAHTHYDEGWDILVECFSPDEVKAAIGKARTLKGALRNVDKALSVTVYASVRDDIRGA